MVASILVGVECLSVGDVEVLSRWKERQRRQRAVRKVVVAVRMRPNRPGWVPERFCPVGAGFLESSSREGYKGRW